MMPEKRSPIGDKARSVCVAFDREPGANACMNVFCSVMQSNRTNVVVAFAIVKYRRKKVISPLVSNAKKVYLVSKVFVYLFLLPPLPHSSGHKAKNCSTFTARLQDDR